ncbi:MAG: hypothetical protein IJW51_00300 [Clostridia bacterium]|nr:hypothetical protein [Clostridia bacterium]
MSKRKKNQKPRTLRRLVIANLLALFALFFTTVVALWAMGLLGSVLAFIF